MTIEAQKVKFTKEGAVTVNAKNIDEIIIREVPNEQIGWKSGAVSPSWEEPGSQKSGTCAKVDLFSKQITDLQYLNRM
jgi:hypothetical protein